MNVNKICFITAVILGSERIIATAQLLKNKKQANIVKTSVSEQTSCSLYSAQGQLQKLFSQKDLSNKREVAKHFQTSLL